MARTASDFDDSRLDFETEREAGGGQNRWPPTPRAFDVRERLAIGRSYLAGIVEREMEARRGFLWLPVAFGAGIAAYFALPGEPSGLALAVTTAALIGGVWLNRFRPAAVRVLVILAMICAGAATATIRTALVQSPMLDRAVTATVTGWISSLEETPDGGRRAYIHVDRIDGFSGPKPRTVRVTIRKGDGLYVGEAISVLAGLTPPDGPVQPGAYDFAEAAFYQGLGAYGFSYGAAKPAALGSPPLDIVLAEPIAAVRATIRRRVEAALPGDDGHVAAALIMGDQNGISATTQNAMRASGLGHILSISGLHLALVAGSVFWLLRALLALSSRLALRYPIKKWAAAAALVVAALYLAISGGGVATVRSFLMLAIMLGAVLLDRRALTLRNVALAAFAVLLFSPESLLSASFQMSFAATAALIAAYEVIALRQPDPTAARGHSLLDRVKREAGALVLTSLIAGLATTPFAVYQFQRLAPLTLVANLAAAPAVGLIIMPMALLTVVAMPFGLEALPLRLMGWGIDWMDAVGAKAAEWSAGYGSVAMPSSFSLLVAVAGFLWLVLWRERWRFAGLAPLAIAVPLAAITLRPDIIVNADGTAAAVRTADGRLHILGSDAFAAQNWLRADGDARDVKDPSIKDGVGCDKLGCVMALPGGGEVALVEKAEAFDEDCRRATIVLSALSAPKGCATGGIVMDASQLAAGGSHALYREAGGYRITDAYPAARRPFMPTRK